MSVASRARVSPSMGSRAARGDTERERRVKSDEQTTSTLLAHARVAANLGVRGADRLGRKPRTLGEGDASKPCPEWLRAAQWLLVRAPGCERASPLPSHPRQSYPRRCRGLRPGGWATPLSGEETTWNLRRTRPRPAESGCTGPHE